MESQPQNPEFKINPENFHPCTKTNQKNICPLNLFKFEGLKRMHLSYDVSSWSVIMPCFKMDK